MKTNVRALIEHFLFDASALLARAQTASGGAFDEQPVPVKAVPPVYPPELLADGTSGVVILKVVIDDNGDVVESTTLKATREEFAAAAIEAVGRWKFKPARKAGQAVRSQISLPIKFTNET
ncbi:MAG TPA: TonB family protein [Opitutus sp.]|nr:TonB family protein [Opitutus sp.]